MAGGDMPVRSFRDLIVWQKALKLGGRCWRTTRTFPRSEMFGLQITRAASSISGNIAEGYGRELTGSYIHSLRIAQGSLKELESHLLLAVEVELLDAPTCEALLVDSEEVGKMLRSLIRALQQRTVAGTER